MIWITTGSPMCPIGVMVGLKWEKKPDCPLMVKYWAILFARVGLNGSRPADDHDATGIDVGRVIQRQSLDYAGDLRRGRDRMSVDSRPPLFISSFSVSNQVESGRTLNLPWTRGVPPAGCHSRCIQSAARKRASKLQSGRSCHDTRSRLPSHKVFLPSRRWGR